MNLPATIPGSPPKPTTAGIHAGPEVTLRTGDDLDDEKPERYADHWCEHRWKKSTWTSKGWITTCKICVSVVFEQ